jgi:hypothetical protein
VSPRKDDYMRGYGDGWRDATAHRAGLQARITAYLSLGGLFNPEMANHEAVRDLLIDCRTALDGKEEVR